MSYFGELRGNWRALVSAAAGHAGGLTINAYIASIFAPKLIAEFHWTRSQFALVSMNILIFLVCMPLVGRLVDKLGVRRLAIIGVIAYPLTYLAFSTMSGNFYHYFAITVAQIAVGSITTQIVYTRLVAPVFHQARGLALAIVNCAPPVAAALAIPLLSAFVETHGWRAGYAVVAAMTAALVVCALILMPRSGEAAAHAGANHRAKGDYGAIFGSGVFWIIIGGVILCSVPQTLHGAQLQLMLLDNGAPTATAAAIIALYAVSVMAGRFACGLALDRFPSHIVAAIGMGLPAIGLVLIASSIDTPFVLAIAVCFIGISQGAEGDICAYLVAQYFDVDVYGSVMGLVGAAIAVSAALGALVLSMVLKATDSYTVFVSIGAVSVVIGGALFLLLRGRNIVRADLALEKA